ncbi:AI-2E family transporter [[Phormidium ambiguum] IAM M-71]|uniref:AI-2E family transporter n=1 Tax=[Phormidium ambiguum] IAM M-71 TaxID=454136 RepID=A0A1U7IRE2_9CYAN|nr:AI-2E family transporter [Phormidium ambiguum]OKH40007.1 AI-2E family transporter [Phormidium ambiguum IAM M-71]
MNQPSNNSIWQQLSNSSRVRSLLMFLLLFICGWAFIQLITYFSTLIFVFTTASIAAALLNYPVNWLARLIPRKLAVIIVFLASLFLLITFVVTIGLEILNQGQGLIDRIKEFIETANPNLPPLKNLRLEENIDRILKTLQSGLTTGLGFLQSTFSNFMLFIIIAVICLYMLFDGSKIWNAVLKLVPLDVRDRFAYKTQKSFLGFFRAQLTLMAFLTIFSLIVFNLLGTRYSLILAIIIGIMDAIPGIGATLGVLIVTTLVLSSQGFWMAVKVLVACIILQQIQDNFISPKVMKDSLDLHPVLLFFAIFVGERVAGILGIFISIPIAAMIATWADEKDLPETKIEQD